MSPSNRRRRPPPPGSSLLPSSATAAVIAIFLVAAGRLPVSRGQQSDLIQQMITNLTAALGPQIKKELGFCFSDTMADFDSTFNYSSDTSFLENCFQEMNDFSDRICTAEEIKLYYSSFFSVGAKTTYLKPNENCNFSTWTSGCQPGWACSIGANQNASLPQADSIPKRTDNCKPICEGFFSPYGITCMMPCPLGSYCPRATFNETTGYCDPYKYQPSPGRFNQTSPGWLNQTCGGADIWADIESSPDIFCPAGSYCSNTIQKSSCDRGYYCRMGSTSETRCLGSSLCRPNSVQQDIKLFGGLMLVALCLSLVFIYFFLDQFIAFREKKLAKVRETAAKMARDSILARGKWKDVKNIVLSHASRFQNKFSRKYSHIRLPKQLELPTVDDHSEHSSEDSISESEEQNTLSSMKSSEGFHANNGDSKSKKKVGNPKHPHTHKEIFEYAYNQLEKEKARQQENQFTLSRVFSMAIKHESRKRPLIEVGFKGLTLTLKGKSKPLLKCVTGKLMPGHITAVMGPSGAGKTTFLTALAGKTAGCDTTGLVLINGKVEPIRSYKRIIGFVPQDDIVHGNLTVEENLWFSARCRLSADLPMADKVLVVERAIEALGLQAVRDSLVGTVEKRGISGGQRKRVNVGLEMVMEPSLLILDEPTSGLDSSSSQLLIRALRREALEGVNICMVVHQPSYTLFNMFDDLILLAKGGMVVYHGPINRVEAYFSGMGIDVPDRVNPPDYYIDILEGIEKPSESDSVKCNHLPLRWMLHNGYDIPPDMQNDLDSIDPSVRDCGPDSARSVDEHTVGGEIWDVLEEKKILKSKNLTNRRTPGILVQYKFYLGRLCKQRLREVRVQVLDYLILCLAGVCLGLLAKLNDENLGVAGYTYTTIAVSLLCQIGALRSFSNEKQQYMRERASGMSSLAYFLSKDTVDHFNTVVKPVVYLSMFYFLNNPRSSFTDNYIILLALVYCVTGIGYTFAICFQPGAAQLWSALLPVVLTLVSTRSNVPVALRDLCYPKWTLEALVVANAKRYTGVWLITRCGLLYSAGYNINYWGLSIAILFTYGLIFRCIAFISLLVMHK